MTAPEFIAGVADGWHAIEAGTVRPGCRTHAWAVCGALVRPACADKGGPRPYEPAEPPQSHDPCPSCFWTVAARTDSLEAALGTLSGIARDIAADVINRTAYEHADDDPGVLLDDEAMIRVLAHVTRHAPVRLVSEGCAEGDHDDHDPGECPGRDACEACSLQAGPEAGEWEGQFIHGLTITAPCAPLLAAAAHAGVPVPEVTP